MKKLFLTLLLFAGTFSYSCFAGEPIEIPMEIIKEGSESNGNPRGPVSSIIVTLEDNILTLPVNHEDFLLQILDADGFIAYSAVVSSGITQIVFPVSLSGSFEIRLVTNTYYYYGYIEL